ncbi:Autophagy protein 22 [Mortierella alpina]|uniref:Autophagy-related protein n=1 Tax=Mortierella alpina TaxID=64518 RepID=A0A9P6LZB8_MORAP|nr:Autophagy protein 22 [Mortierella alpina]
MRVTFSPAPVEPATTKKEIWAWYSYAFASEAYVVALTVVSISSMADYGPYRKKQLIFFSIVGSMATMLIGAVPYVWMAGALSIIANVSFGAGIVCFNAYLPLLVRNVDRIRLGRQELQQLEKETESQVAHLEQARPTSTQPSQDSINERSAAIRSDLTETSLLDSQERLAASQTETVPTSESIEQKKKLHAELSEQLNEDKARLMGQISARGFASGYFGGILLLLVCLYISYRDKSSVRSLKIGIFLSGLWWFIFAALTGVWLKQRPGRELRLGERDQKRGSLWIATRYVLYSWNRVGATIVQARKLPSAFAFLVAWFFLSDGYTSIANVALLFAKTSLQLPQTQLILLSLVVPICALIGTLLFPKLQRALGFNPKQMVLLLLMMLVMVPLYGTLGLILPFWPHLSSAAELFTLAAYFGLLIGSVQRSMFADLVPRGRESEFFGLYAITDKGSSWLGPLAVAAITDATHEIRHAFVFLLVLLTLPIPIIYFGVDLAQGRIDAEKASLELQQTLETGMESGQDEDEERERLLSSV